MASQILRTSITVKFEGIARKKFVSPPGSNPLGLNPREYTSHGKQVAGVRRICNGVIERQGLGDQGLRNVELALHRLSHFGTRFLVIEDIVNQSACWRGIRSEADRVEASESEQ